MELRDYQAAAVDNLRASYRAGKKSPLFVLPTGGGKTAVFSYIARAVLSRGGRAMILVHRQELLLQASVSLDKLNVPHGLISPLYPKSTDAIQIASVQTVVRRLETTTAPNLIIVDEAHHATSGTYQKIFTGFPNAQILGVTATPIRSDGKGLSEVFDDIIIGPSIANLIERGFLARPTVYAPPIGIDLIGVHKKMGDYDRAELGHRIDKPSITGSAVDHYIKHAAGEPGIAFCVSVEHANHVAAEFSARGIRAVRVDGGMRSDDRRNAIEGLGNGTIDLLTSADLIGEGVDVPRVSVAMLLRPTQSLGLYLQQVGRALRPYPGKSRALILDHVGNVMKHGFPDSDRSWSLDGADKRAGRDLELAVKVSQCPKCFYVYERGPGECPACGSTAESKARKILEVEGELKELERESVERVRREARIEAGRARSFEDLKAIETARGYKNGWAIMRFNARKRA